MSIDIATVGCYLPRLYLRTTRRKNSDGSTVEYYQLAENVWDRDRGCAVAKVVYSFGRSDQLDRDMLRRLAQSILRVFSAQEALAVDPEVKVYDAWPYGGVHVLDSLWHELGIDQVVSAQAQVDRVRQPFERALFAMTANRALRPYSKLYCYEQWLPKEVFFDGREGLELHHLYGAMDFLEKHTEEIEKQVYLRIGIIKPVFMI